MKREDDGTVWAICPTCDEPVDTGDYDTIPEDDNFFHAECRPELAKCVWCGEGVRRSHSIYLSSNFIHQHCFQEAHPMRKT